MSDVRFGLITYSGAMAGVHLQSVTYGETASTAEATDESGNIEQVDVFGRKRTIQCEGNVLNGGSISQYVAGGTLTIDGDEYRIESVSIKEVVNGHKTITVNGSAPISGGTSGTGGTGSN